MVEKLFPGKKERKKHPRVNRSLIMLLLVKALLLSACAPAISSNQPPDTPTPAVTAAASDVTAIPSYTLEPTLGSETITGLFDFCSFPEDPTLFDQQVSGTPVPDSIIQIGNIEALKIFKLSAENIQGFKEVGAGTRLYRILLVPVGYDQSQIDARFSFLTDTLKKIYGEVESLDFGYLNVNIPIGVKKSGSNSLSYTDEEEKSVADQAIRNALGGDRESGYIYIYVVNGVERSDGGWFPLFAAGGDETGAHTIAHVVGHAFNLGDEYPYYTSLEEIDHSNQALFTSLDKQDPVWEEALTQLDEQPPIGVVGTCNDTLVYRFYPNEDNIMRLDTIQSDLDLLRKLKRGERVLNPLQVAEVEITLSHALNQP